MSPYRPTFSVDSPAAGTALVTKIRSPQITGLEWPRPGISVFHKTWSPFSPSHCTGGAPLPTPLAAGPRNCGQLEPESAAAAIAAVTNIAESFMGISVVRRVYNFKAGITCVMMCCMRIVWLLVLLSGAAWGQWDRFRGPNGTGVSESAGLPAEFGPKKNLIWRTELPPGHSSPVIGGERIYLTGVEHEQLYTFCVEPASGRILWKREAPRSRHEKLHSLNNPASPTPVTDSENVYVFFSDFGLLSYTRAGKERWRLPLGPFKNVYGMGVSPVLADDVVVLVIDQDKDSFIVGVGRNDGKVRWQKPRPEALSGASTPVVVKNSSGPSLILAPASFRLDVYSARDGEAVWWVRGLPGEMKSGPAVVGDFVYVS